MDKRCCAKTHAKHHRWKRKWNCCSAVPDSPDVSDDVIRTISDSVTATALHQQQQYTNCNNRDASTGFPTADRPPLIVDPIRNPLRINGMVRTASLDQKLYNADHSLMSRMENVPNQSLTPQSPMLFAKVVRPRLVRPWPIARFRRMLRMIGRYRRTDCRGHVSQSSSHRDDRCGGGDVVKQNQIRPLSAEQHFSQEPIRLPVLPPPSRRKIRHSNDLQELTQTLSFEQQSTRCLTSTRRQRRKNAMRNKSPTLSPIHESGLSNPTSPQPFRHSYHHAGGGYTIAIPQTLNDTP